MVILLYKRQVFVKVHFITVYFLNFWKTMFLTWFVSSRLCLYLHYHTN
jgi:hypothetical protein